METSVYVAGLEPLKDRELYRRALDTASPERRKKALRYRREDSRLRSLGGELLLRRALEDCGLEAGELRYEYGDHGKPRLAGQEEFHFSLSHSGSYVMLAVSERELGCDLEQITEPRLKVARRYFAREEWEHLSSTAGEEQTRLFFRYWTLKESFLKATGQGLHLPLDAFQIVLGEDGSVTVRQSFDEREYHFAEFQTIPGYCCALCQSGAFQGARWENVNFREMFCRSGGASGR